MKNYFRLFTLSSINTNTLNNLTCPILLYFTLCFTAMLISVLSSPTRDNNIIRDLGVGFPAGNTESSSCQLKWLFPRPPPPSFFGFSFPQQTKYTPSFESEMHVEGEIKARHVIEEAVIKRIDKSRYLRRWLARRSICFYEILYLNSATLNFNDF